MVLPDPLGVTKADEEAKFLLTPTAGELKKGFAAFSVDSLCKRISRFR